MPFYLVTGGAGFIGSNIVKELVRRNDRIRIIDNLSTGKLENIEDYLKNIEFIKEDIRDFSACQKAVRGVNYVLHQAALPSVKRSIDDILSSNSTNIDGTLNILEAAKREGVKKVVFASSSSVYGNTDTLPKTESMAANPLSPYAVEKYTGEQYCKIFHEIYGLRTVCLRYFNVFGPGQDPASEYSAVIPKFIYSMLKKQPPVIYGDGYQSRDFTYVENVVEANLLACHSQKVGRGEVINIGGGNRTTLNQLVSYLSEIIGYDGSVLYEKARKGDVLHSLADITSAQSLLNYNVKVKMKEGLNRTVEWFRGKRL
ncbi:MAG: UDP-glucose 4-epimerase (Galactowaldenase) (UDP-galactose 4-epimerase) (GalE-like) [Clostridia bacterium]|uniref:SDR family oxidoreductase n=1 Tax=Petroclostridium xylanilyticum TaxID=1792311 RepID=UPI000B97D390|nr:SDR family oxidoreductase [Petroclostridium xylanilyticum]MBZ4645635.1 UDP-glucose 4-epimerase (Galactowaldenase) (UDP-galactose 4-epimerase) (GalE-like) [Clostridia bacterium]